MIAYAAALRDRPWLQELALSDLEWWRRIREAKMRGHFTSDDRALAGNWTTCACGRQGPRILRGVCGAPLDDQLYDLGMDFHRCVAHDAFDSAAKMLWQIEQRAAAVLAKAIGKQS